jgi:alanyl-tRNA synthetase
LAKGFEEIIGPGEQKGSWVGDNKFRWDVSVDRPITPQEINQLEILVNKIIKEDREVKVEYLSLEEAKNKGYHYLNNTYYEPQVRCINVDHWSKEMCHGTHVNNTGELLGFKILKKKSVSATTVRWECITGDSWLEYQKIYDQWPPLMKNLWDASDDGEKKLLESLVKSLGEKNYSQSHQIYKQLMTINDRFKVLQSFLPSKEKHSWEILEEQITTFNSQSLVLVLAQEINLELYDHYKYKYDLVVLTNPHQGIIMGSEHYKNLLDNLIEFIDHQWSLKGNGGKGKVFKGKIMNPWSSVDFVKALELSRFIP